MTTMPATRGTLFHTLIAVAIYLAGVVGGPAASASFERKPRGWHLTNLSGLLSDQPRFPATRFDRAASVQAQGVVWLADNPMVSRSWYFAGNAIALWDRKGVSYLTPYPPDWSWTGVWEPSAWGTQVAFPLAAVWPPDAGPTDPHYIYSEMFYLDDQGLKRITCDQASQHVVPSLHEGKVAWQSRSAPDWTDDWEIYFWDGATTRRITDNDAHDTHPSLYANVIAWCSGTTSPESIGNIVYLSVPPAGHPGPLPRPVLVGPGEAPCLFKNKIAYHASDATTRRFFCTTPSPGKSSKSPTTITTTRTPRFSTGPSPGKGTPLSSWGAGGLRYPTGMARSFMTSQTTHGMTT